MSVIKRILLATDLSEANKKAVEHAKHLRDSYSAELTVIFAITVPSYYSFKTLSYDEIKSELLSKYQTHFDAFIQENDLVNFANHIEVGDVFEVLYDYVSTNHIDLLVLGSHGEHGIRDQIGSTVFKVLQRSPCNIFIANSR